MNGDKIRIEYSNDIDVPELVCVEFEMEPNKKLKKINKKKWQKEKRYTDKNFQRVRKEIENR